MQIGSIVIVGDLLGFVTDISGNNLTVRNKLNEEHLVTVDNAHEVANPNAIALMMHRKIFGGECNE